MSQDQKDNRREYDRLALRRSDLNADPMNQFEQWLDAAVAADLVDATAMSLATVSTAGHPSARIVLLKHFDASGYVWYSSYASQKGVELAANPEACLLFYWREFERQVRISGTVTQLSKAASQAYFDSRPHDSRLSAASSQQSQVVPDREALERQVSVLESELNGKDVPMPEDWGGFCLSAHTYEFWQGRAGRLHDRFRYQATDQGWQVDRLQP